MDKTSDKTLLDFYSKRLQNNFKRFTDDTILQTEIELNGIFDYYVEIEFPCIFREWDDYYMNEHLNRHLMVMVETDRLAYIHNHKTIDCFNDGYDVNSKKDNIKRIKMDNQIILAHYYGYDNSFFNIRIIVPYKPIGIHNNNIHNDFLYIDNDGLLRLRLLDLSLFPLGHDDLRIIPKIIKIYQNNRIL